MSSPDLLDVFDRHIASGSAPAHASNGPLYLPAPMSATPQERRAAQGPTYTCSITAEATRYLAARHAAYDAAVSQVVAAYRADKKPGNAWERRQEAMARITATLPDRNHAEEQAAVAAATAVEQVWADVVAQLQALYPSG